ncbi:winged helix DNA-binding protein [Geothrix alkalitolerans]|uniref:winged helix DNA-binding protein n=1 Tax=Geothrix alkalitolerans TaxID=2922724 RepID=UPI001FAEEF2D|nr:winged helix DNA-binding protein [Geothrix alkalitolerans]
MTIPLDDPVFLGRTVERLSTLIETQSEVIFKERGVLIPVKSCSLMTQLARLEHATAADLARALNVSHQLVLQKLPKLLKLRLITATQDLEDARKKSFSLTATGKKQIEIFLECRDLIKQAYAGLFDEVGDLFSLTNTFVGALEKKPLSERIRNH